MIEEPPSTITPAIQHTWPGPSVVEGGAWAVQPDAAAPPWRKKPAQTMVMATGTSQKEHMLSLGNAMSSAPILSGMRELPKTPRRRGMMAKKIITEPCIVKSML